MLMVAKKIFASSKAMPKQGDHQEKTHEKDKAMRDSKPFGNKDSRPNNGKKKEKNGYKGQNSLTLEVMEKYCKENQCFCCGEQGHSYPDCPKKTPSKLRSYPNSELHTGLPDIKLIVDSVGTTIY